MVRVAGVWTQLYRAISTWLAMVWYGRRDAPLCFGDGMRSLMRLAVVTNRPILFASSLLLAGAISEKPIAEP